MKIQLIDYGADQMPTRAHYNDAGADVYMPCAVGLLPGDVCKIPLGFGIALPDGFVGFIFPRSSWTAKGITCELPPIDSGYRGEVYAVITNNGRQFLTIERGERIGQLVVLPCVIPEYSLDPLGDERGTGAFGSSGK